MTNEAEKPKRPAGQVDRVVSWRFIWDSFSWRWVAAFYIAWWFLKLAPMKDLPFTDRWSNVKWAWKTWRASIMLPHERHKYRQIDEVLAELREREAS